LNREVAKDAKFKTRSLSIVQNRDTVLDNAAFQFAACPVKSEAFLTGVSRQIENIFPWSGTQIKDLSAGRAVKKFPSYDVAWSTLRGC